MSEMNLTFHENAIEVKDFIRLKEEAFDISCPRQIAMGSIKSSLYILHAEHDGKVIAMARILESNNLSYHLTDLIVSYPYQDKGLGKLMMERVIEYARQNLDISSDKNLGLFSPKSKESFYEKFGFRSDPNDSLHTGNKMYLKEEE